MFANWMHITHDHSGSTGMCGVAGFLRYSGEAGLDVQVPLDVLAHRGPDDVDWTHSTNLSLGHRRLSILDLTSAGRQPMSLDGGRLTLVFNGEIYNYRELRAELIALGRTFHTQTDTEVLLHAYDAWGEGALRRLVGMFAFALEDRAQRRLLLVRDFFGIKPLYYTQTADGLAFASEIKALARWLPLKRIANAQRVLDYLCHGWTDHGAETMWREIQQVPAAHYLAISLDTPQRQELIRYWHPPEEPALELSLDEAAERVRACFLDNLRLHLRSDVPLGAALSGGIDSSAILAGMRYLDPTAELHAISYIADDNRLSEERWIDLVGARTGARIHKVRPAPDELSRDLDQLIRTQDEPFVSTSIYAQYRVFQKAREVGIKVMLDGQGADELFAGYRSHLPGRLASLLRQGRWRDAWSFARNQRALPGAPSASKLLLQSLRRMTRDTRAMCWLERLRLPGWLNHRWLRTHNIGMPCLPGSTRADALREQLEQSLRSTSLPMLLRFEDRNSMAASIESRVPFLTPVLAELALRLPEAHILGADGTSKHVFRRAMRGIVPQEILDRRDKIGFETPEQAWLQSLRPWIDETLHSERANAIPMLDATAMRRDWARIANGRARFDSRVWRWVNLIRWAEHFDIDFDEP